MDMRSLDEARKWWPQFDNVRSLSHLRHRIGEQGGETSITIGLRSVCWKCFLLFKSVDRSTWLTALADSRSAYDALRMHFLRAVQHPDELESAIDPLSERNESPWVALRQDEALRAEIFQDVERCMPDNVYFRQPSTQNMMLDILFIFCKLNPDVGYKQGMHELLAPILWVIERDAAGPNSARDDGGQAQRDDDLLKIMFDLNYVEHDAFTLFSLLMQNAKSFYESNETRRPIDKISSGSHQGVTPETPMLNRCRRIFEHYLPRADPELAAHLHEVDVVPQIFLMRWIRLLFGREFPFNDVLSMWDVLFAEDPSLELVDHICLAMLLRVRWRLIEADNSAALTLLLHYPEPASYPPRTFVNDALYLKEHLNFDGGSHIISTYTKRPPPLISRVETSRPQRSAKAPQRISARSSHRAPSPVSPPAKSVLQPGGLESLLQDAARNVYSRGEKWGFNQAVRDAVGEVKKNVQGLQLPPTPSPPRTRHRAASSQTIGGRDAADSSGDTPSDLMRRIADFEERSRSLAKMLEGAVAELWDFQKAGFDAKPDEDSVKALSVAIAKVQFVQVYLEDASIPLPTEETHTENERVAPATTAPPTGQSATPPPLRAPIATSTQPAESKATAPAIPNLFPDAADQSQRSSATMSTTSPTRKPHRHPSTAQVPPAARTPTPSRSAPPAKPTSNLAPPVRPPLAQSSFSWMLGQGESSPSPTSPTLPFGVGGSERRRFVGRGFLFGEEDDDGEERGEEAARRGGKGAKKGKREGKPELFDLEQLGKR